MSTEIHQRVLQGLAKRPAAIVISDYGKGTIDFNITRLLVSTNLPCYVDTKNSHIEWFRGANVTLFPNWIEYESCVQGKEHLVGTVVAKHGPWGCYLWDAKSEKAHLPACRREVMDCTGAGDCFLSAYIWAKLNGLDSAGAAAVANEAAGISVSHLGTYIVKPADIEKVVAEMKEIAVTS